MIRIPIPAPRRARIPILHKHRSILPIRYRRCVAESHGRFSVASHPVRSWIIRVSTFVFLQSQNTQTHDTDFLPSGSGTHPRSTLRYASHGSSAAQRTRVSDLDGGRGDALWPSAAHGVHAVRHGRAACCHMRTNGMRTRSHVPCQSSAAGRASMCIATGRPGVGRP